jgi:hypothetical protein
MTGATLARIALLASALLGTACNRQDAEATTEEKLAAPVIAPAVLDQWLGDWNGPEGTLLSIARVGEVYTIRIKDLDRTTSFQGAPVATGLQFERRGTLETLHATDGAGTGMKWLADKQECLTVRPGEGYCRH